MLRIQPGPALSQLEKETLANMDRDGLRHTQFVKGDANDRKRACDLGWREKLLDFQIPDDKENRSYEAVLDSLAGFTRSSDGCAHFQKKASDCGVKFLFGNENGGFHRILEEQRNGQRVSVGVRTNDGRDHPADVVVIAGTFTIALSWWRLELIVHSWVIFNAAAAGAVLPSRIFGWQHCHLQD